MTNEQQPGTDQGKQVDFEGNEHPVTIEGKGKAQQASLIDGENLSK